MGEGAEAWRLSCWSQVYDAVRGEIMFDNVQEKRKHVRHTAEAVFGTVQCKFDLKVLNINKHGATIETTKRLELYKEYTFKIFSLYYSFRVKGYTVWSMLTQRRDNGGFSPVYRTGIKFIPDDNNPIKLHHGYEALCEQVD